MRTVDLRTTGASHFPVMLDNENWSKSNPKLTTCQVNTFFLINKNWKIYKAMELHKMKLSLWKPSVGVVLLLWMMIGQCHAFFVPHSTTLSFPTTTTTLKTTKAHVSYLEQCVKEWEELQTELDHIQGKPDQVSWEHDNNAGARPAKVQCLHLKANTLKLLLHSRCCC